MADDFQQPTDNDGGQSHVEKARLAILDLHAAHENAASPLERAVDYITGNLGRPAALLCVLLGIAAWIGGNLAAPRLGLAAADTVPFPKLEFALTAGAFVVAILILATQRRADRLAEARQRMTLELSLQGAQKISKIIALLEELRRDLPSVPDRPDPQATDMSTRPVEAEVAGYEQQQSPG